MLHAYNNHGAFPPRVPASGEFEQLVDVHHPLVRAHPVTGEPALYFDLDRAVAVDGLPEVEGRALLQRLQDGAEQHAPRYAHAWHPHDVLVWDNAAVQHRADGDFPVGEPRNFWRYMIEGPEPALRLAGEAAGLGELQALALGEPAPDAEPLVDAQRVSQARACTGHSAQMRFAVCLRALRSRVFSCVLGGMKCVSWIPRQAASRHHARPMDATATASTSAVSAPAAAATYRAGATSAQGGRVVKALHQAERARGKSG